MKQQIRLLDGLLKLVDYATRLDIDAIPAFFAIRKNII